MLHELCLDNVNGAPESASENIWDYLDALFIGWSGRDDVIGKSAIISNAGEPIVTIFGPAKSAYNFGNGRRKNATSESFGANRSDKIVGAGNWDTNF